MILYQFLAQIMPKMVNCPEKDFFTRIANNMFFMFIFVHFLLQNLKITILSCQSYQNY